MMQEYREKMRGGAIDGDDNVDNENHRSKQKKHAYQTSGPGDAHIVSNIHFIYQRLLKKFHYPMDVLLNYAEFAKSEKSFKVMSRVYAEGLQRYPREVGLWIQVSFFVWFVCALVLLLSVLIYIERLVGANNIASFFNQIITIGCQL